MATYKTLDPFLVKQHYAREDVQKAILTASNYKEVVGSYGGQGYAKRPDALYHLDDITTQVKAGITSFHASEELWDDPLRISADLPKEELASLRRGWDLLLDIDCKDLQISQIAADLIIKILKHYGLTCISCKFSGNHGFHIAVPWEAFPKVFEQQETRLLFPDAPRKIASHLKRLMGPKLRERLLAYFDKPDKAELLLFINEEFGKELQTFDPFALVEIDTILLASRHLYRQVYSLNEKSGLVSIPINPDKVLQFKKSIATIEAAVFSRYSFLDRSQAISDQATELLVASYDDAQEEYLAQKIAEEKKTQARRERIENQQELTEKIPDHCFPPQIKKMLGPLQDGKKRALFILSYFLKNVGYSFDEIEETLIEWNKKHPQPLRDQYLSGQLRYVKTSEILPPNFSQMYVDIVGEVSDDLSQKLKNPVVYARARYQAFVDSQPKKKKAKQSRGQVKESPQLQQSKKDSE